MTDTTTMMSHIRSFAPLAAIALLASRAAGCGGPSLAPVPFTSLDAVTQAKYEKLIAKAFPAGTSVNVRYDKDTLEKHPRDAAVLTRLGYIERGNGTYRFTPAGREASTGKCDYSRNPCVDFPVASNELVAADSLQFRTNGAIGEIGSVIVKVRVRTIATTPLGKALAGSSDLVCEAGTGYEPWRAAGSLSAGVVVMSIYQSLPDATFAAAADAVARKTERNGPVGPYVESTCPSYPGQYANVGA